MAKKVLYVFNCPLAKYTKRLAAKVGITGSFAVRLGVYQNSYSDDNHTACFNIAYIGKDHAINNLEKAIKQIYDWQIEKDGRGHSEWISGLEAKDISVIIDKLIKEDGYLVEKVDPKFLTLNRHNLQEFSEWLDEKRIN